MDNSASASMNAGDNPGTPDDLRCKRSDGKQWRCTATSMPGKTVCEKHYYQAKRRAISSAMRARLKKQSSPLGDTDIYLESKSDDFELPLVKTTLDTFPVSGSSALKRHKRKALENNLFQYSPETSFRNLQMRSSGRTNGDPYEDGEFDESWRMYKMPPDYTMDSSRSRRSINTSDMMDYSAGSSDSSEENGGQPCHQCHRNNSGRVIWCLKCDKRGYCESCISARYSEIPVEEIEKLCPSCRGTCTCRVCLRSENMVKVKIREIPVLDKLQYLYCLLSSVLPIVKKIHREQCFEVELEKNLRGANIDLVRAKLNADEQMCCNICRIPIVDYHRHCPNCSYDLCLHCCQDLRGPPKDNTQNGTHLEHENQSRFGINIPSMYPGWVANSDGSIPCPPKNYGGCGHSSLDLSRIFKMNWVAKLVKNAEEMVSGCKVDDSTSQQSGMYDSRHTQYAHRQDSEDNFLYCQSSEDIKVEGISNFRKHWSRGEPVIVKEIFDSRSMLRWDPTVIWRCIPKTSDEKMKDDRLVKAVDCLNWSEVDIELGQFIKGYSEGRLRGNGSLEMLKLKDWPSPSACEEFLIYQRPEFISKLPLLEYIHSRLGVLNVAAKSPHHSLQTDVGPKIYMSYGTKEELGRGDSVTNIHFKMHDMVYLLVHTHEVELKTIQKTRINEECVLELSSEGANDTESNGNLALDNGERMWNQEAETTARADEFQRVESEGIGAASISEEIAMIEGQQLQTNQQDVSAEPSAGVCWDIFRRQDVPRLVDYLNNYCKELGAGDIAGMDFTTYSLYDGKIFLDEQHKRKLKDEFGVEPWSFEQSLGEAVFVPAGCPCQMRYLQSNVQLALDFLFPESVGEAARLAEEIRCLENDHEAKPKVLEVGKISLYAASSAIKEVQKLVLDPKLGTEIGFEDPNLTAAVVENLGKYTNNRKQISCT